MGCFPTRSTASAVSNYEIPEETSISFLKSSPTQRITNSQSFLSDFRRVFIKPFLNTSFKYSIFPETHSFGHFGLNSRVQKAEIVSSKVPVLIEQVPLIEIDGATQAKIKAFFSNFDSIRSLDHPNLLTLLDIYEDKDNLCLVYEDFNGGVDLYDKICEMGCFTEKLSGVVLKDLFSIFSYLQSLGLSLNKLSAESFFVRFSKGAYQVKLMDLTLICSLTQLLENVKSNQKNEGFSRDFYTPPETPTVFTVENYKKESFSLGVIFFLMLKGNFPFNQEESDDIEEIHEFYKINYEELEISQKTSGLLRGLLELDPEKRFSIVEVRNSMFFKEIARNKPDNLSELMKSANREAFLNPLLAFFKTIAIRFFGDQAEKQKLFETFQEIDEDGDGFISADIFNLQTIKTLLSFEDFLVLVMRNFVGGEKKAKESIFLEISKGNAKEISIEALREFVGKEIIDQEVLEPLFVGIGGKGGILLFEAFQTLQF